MKSSTTDMLFQELIQFAKNNSFLELNNAKEEKEFMVFLNELSGYLFEDYIRDKLGKKYKKWNQYFSAYSLREFCFHSSVFEYIFLTLMTIEYYKKQIKDKKIKKLEITILTTQSPKKIDGKPNDEYNIHFPTASALASYSSIFCKMIAESNGDITVNRHFLYQDIDYEKTNMERIRLIYPIKLFQKCYCEAPICRDWLCCNNKSKNKNRGCKNNRNKFLSQPFTNHYVFNLTNLINITEKLSNPEIREFIGFKITESDDRSYYKHAYTSNLTDTMTSMFIKMWSSTDLYAPNAKLPFIGVDRGYLFEEVFINALKNNQNDENSLRCFWGLEDVQNEAEEKKQISKEMKKIKNRV